ncbi:BTB/POZ domain-containing protein 16-like isoform X1 [Pomacea canaliculata]|uniref:BTB/POZ domain-containing protein 16-like isoform X1 n=1 Tax=Pomacea canaliculata TaxID=400727 RepID=UPI000D73C0FE|nr:BTB/POZ domain-containing protein 16-like isoform X1 [Pomacea canaliculata]
MAQASSVGLQSRLTASSYLPAIPPKVPKESSSYPRYVHNAPYSALSGIVVDGRVPVRHLVFPRCRERHQVGMTNRWRLPDSLYSDLLGNSQALKAVDMPYNSTLVSLITAESPKLSSNLEVNVPYTFRRSSDRPLTTSRVTPSSRRSASKLLLSTTVPQVRFESKSLSLQAKDPVKASKSLHTHYSTPRDIFLYHTRKSTSFAGPDVLLNCLDVEWDLYRPFMQKAEVLAQLLREAEDPNVHKCSTQPSDGPQTLDSYIYQSKAEGGEGKERDSHLRASTVKHSHKKERVNALDSTTRTSPRRQGSFTFLKLDIDDPMVTKRAMAVALGNLYHGDLEVEVEDAASVLAAAAAIGFGPLMEWCTEVMLSSIACHNVCRYHLAASKYQKQQLVQACERWLEMNLIPKLSTHMHLKEMSMDLLQKILKSNRLFVYNEYSVYRTLVVWLFLQINPEVQLLPSHSTVTAFFNSLPKTCSFLETEEGQTFFHLFQILRLHSVTDSSDIHDILIMNIVPEKWILTILSEHYHALQRGGDMKALREFHSGAVRHGFIIDDEPHYHSEVISLHGFHFELKALVEDPTSNTYVVFLERLKPGDPILSFRQCERQTFSMRSEREVRYSLTMQYMQNQDTHTVTTGMLTHKFGLGEKTCRSEILSFSGIPKPMYVSAALLFPPS